MRPPFLPRHAALAFCATLLAASLPAQVPGALRGRVVDDRTGQPLSGVEVTIPATSRSATTDSSGAFALRDVAAGRHEVVLRKVGYQQLSAVIAITGAADPEQLLRVVPVATDLAQVTVTTPAVDRRLGAFEAHRAARMGGSFLTAAELEPERCTVFPHDHTHHRPLLLITPPDSHRPCDNYPDTGGTRSSRASARVDTLGDRQPTRGRHG